MKKLLTALTTATIITLTPLAAHAASNTTTAPAQGSDTDKAWVCNKAGLREPNTTTDIGYGPQRNYTATTNNTGQLITVTAEEIIPQNDDTEDITTKNRYCNDEAKVPGTDNKDYDEGHAIADSLGGVSNAYNITPQNSYLNRHGQQSQMERDIRNAGGAHNFAMTIYYPDATTLTPSGYDVTYTLNGDTHPTTLSYANTKEGDPNFDRNTSSNSPDTDYTNPDDHFIDNKDAPLLAIGAILFIIVLEFVRRKLK